MSAQHQTGDRVQTHHALLTVTEVLVHGQDITYVCTWEARDRDGNNKTWEATFNERDLMPKHNPKPHKHTF